MDWDNPKPAPGSLALVQDFVNTRNYFHGGDLLGTLEEATARLAERGLLEEGERVGEAERQRLVAFREGLRGLLLAHNGVTKAEPGAEAGTLDELVASGRLEGALRAARAPRPRAQDRGRSGRTCHGPPARGGGPGGGGGEMGAPEGLPQRGVPLGLLRRLQESLRGMVQHASLRRQAQDARLPRA